MHEPVNPYQRPVADSVPARTCYAVHPVSPGKRVLNLLIDQVMIQIAIFGVFFVLGMLLVLSGTDALPFLGNEGFSTLLGVLTYLGYYIVLEAAFGRTIGKFITRTIVVNDQGLRASLGQIVGRSFARCIPFKPFSCLGDRGWHDSLANTWVVDSRKPAVEGQGTPPQTLRPSLGPGVPMKRLTPRPAGPLPAGPAGQPPVAVAAPSGPLADQDS